MKEKIYDFSKIKAIIGLGNPGGKYYNTRHSIGFCVADVFVDRYGGSWSKNELMEYSQVLISDDQGFVAQKIFVIKPLTFMNNSGKVLPFLLKKGIKPEEILVVHDELEKPFGKNVIRWNGSSRGHNGLRSICGVIGGDFWHLRFGIGRPADKSDVGNYVLSSFTHDEEAQIGELVERAIDLIEGI